VVPAYIGRTALKMAQGDHASAIETGERGLEIADRTGYVIWILPHLLPLIGEAYIRLLDLDGAARVGERLRRESKRMEHKLGLAWADTADALVAWHSGDVERAAALLRESAEALEALEIIPEAARIRRQLAGRLAELDRRDEALGELRKVHEVFGRLGAQPELSKAREQFRELGSRPPSRSEAEGTADLTPREAEIARLVADRKSNKAIARHLDISPRTVSTHLSNLYRKLEIGSRGELVDLVREARLPLK
jgi:DNA-binding CsgD family transcriptional regulator